jgi:hypothetical protein
LIAVAVMPERRCVEERQADRERVRRAAGPLPPEFRVDIRVTDKTPGKVHHLAQSRRLACRPLKFPRT